MILSAQSCRRTSRTRTYAGFTLTEIAIVLGIIGLILGAIWTAAARVYANQRVNKAVTEIMAIVNGVRATYGGKGSISSTPDTFLTTAGISFGWFPADMVFGGTPNMPWGSATAVEVIANTGLGGAPGASNQFVIYIAGGDHITNVPASECPAFMSALVQQALSSGLTWIYTNAKAGLTLTPTTAISDDHIINCHGDVVLSFQL